MWIEKFLELSFWENPLIYKPVMYMDKYQEQISQQM